MNPVRHSRTRRVQRAFAIVISLLVAAPDAVLAAEETSASKSMDRMSPQELERFVQQLNESANWRKYRRPSDPPDFVPGKPVKVMHGAGSSFGRGGGMSGGGQSFRRGGLANRRNARSGRGRSRDDAMAQSRGSSRSNRSSSSARSGSRSSSGSSLGNSSRTGSRGFGSSSRNGGSSFGNNSNNGSFEE
jgi:hypothetical protein